MPKTALIPSEIVSPKNLAVIEAPSGDRDTVGNWLALFFRVEVTTAPSSQREQWRDLNLFRDFMLWSEQAEARSRWTPRLTAAFQQYLRGERNDDGERRWGDKAVNRTLDHLKRFAKWIHRLAPFPLGEPTARVAALRLPSALEIERAITPAERRRLLDAADLLPERAGRSCDRKHYRGKERPLRAMSRPWRDRAIVYALIETGMRRSAVTKITVTAIDWSKRTIAVPEKGGAEHRYHVSQEGLAAIRDYLDRERPEDAEAWDDSTVLFLSPRQNAKSGGPLCPRSINNVWGRVCAVAGVCDKTPHSARHAMGKHIMEKTGNVAAVQRQLGHRNAVYSMQYARISGEELRAVLDERE
jgi:integrase